MKTRERHLHITAVFFACVCIFSLLAVNGRAGEIRFTSVPDIFNWNIGNPQPGWEQTIDWFLDRLLPNLLVKLFFIDRLAVPCLFCPAVSHCFGQHL